MALGLEVFYFRWGLKSEDGTNSVGVDPTAGVPRAVVGAEEPRVEDTDLRRRPVVGELRQAQITKT